MLDHEIDIQLTHDIRLKCTGCHSQVNIRAIISDQLHEAIDVRRDELLQLRHLGPAEQLAHDSSPFGMLFRVSTEYKLVTPRIKEGELAL